VLTGLLFDLLEQRKAFRAIPLRELDFAEHLAQLQLQARLPGLLLARNRVVEPANRLRRLPLGSQDAAGGQRNGPAQRWSPFFATRPSPWFSAARACGRSFCAK